MANQKRCTKCVLPKSTPGIYFDDNGVCNYCHDYKLKTVQGEEALLKILNRYRNKENEYDCMVGVSGGRDSTFLMWKLAHDYKMRLLAVHYDNPFSSKQAKKNLENAVEKLGIDLIKWTYPDRYFHEKETRKALMIWSRKPSHSMLPIICAVCKGWWPTFFRIARKKNISLIVIGSNPFESASFKEASFGAARTYFRMTRLHKSIGKGLGELAKNPAYMTCSWPAIIKSGLLASHSSPIARLLYKDINVVRLFDFIKWNEAEVLSTISENLGWEKDPDHNSPWRFDCRLDHIKKFLYKNTIGVSELEDLFSKMIRENMITRDEVLERLKTEDVTPIKLVENVLDQINLKFENLNWPADWSMD